MDRWERRARKLDKRRQTMKVSGAGLKRLLLPLIQKKVERAERAAAARRRKGYEPQ